MKNPDYEEQVKLAIERVAEYDKAIGRKDRELLTIAIALQTGLSNPDTGAHYEALVMIWDAVRAEAKKQCQ